MALQRSRRPRGKRFQRSLVAAIPPRAVGPRLFCSSLILYPSSFISHPFSLHLLHRVKPANFKTPSALDATRLVDQMDLLTNAGNARHRAIPRANRAANALRRVDLVMHQGLALVRGAAMLDNVGHVLVVEMFERAQYR